MKILKSKTLILLMLFIGLAPIRAYGFESGPILQLRTDFGGGVTVPSISAEALDALNPMATGMSGSMSNLLMGVEVEGGYVFRSHDFFGLSKSNPFSGVGAFVYLGFSQGNTSQKISVNPGGNANPFDIFINVDYLPVINFGTSGKAYFFNNRLALGLSMGGKMIADMSPQYFAYSNEPIFNDGLSTSEIGTIIVTEKMAKNMNPFMFSIGGSIEYSIEILPTTELILGFFTQYNSFKPKYLTVPPTLAAMGEAAAEANGDEFDIENTPFPDYKLDSVEFGIRIGLSFRL